MNAVRSNTSLLSSTAPASKRAISSRALKVLMISSASSIVRSKPARYSLAERDSRSAASARLRRRLSGVLRSWAILSETSRRLAMSCSMRSSMALRLRESSSSSSPVPLLAIRRERSPRMIDSLVAVISAIRFKINRLASNPPARPSATSNPKLARKSVRTRSMNWRCSSTSRATSNRWPPASAIGMPIATRSRASLPT